MLYTASYFEPNNHHGRLIASSASIPKLYANIETFKWIVPNWHLIKSWKTTVTNHKNGFITEQALLEHWNTYYLNYMNQLNSSRRDIIEYFASFKTDATVLCWEKTNDLYPQCHRRILGIFLKKHLPNSWGGNDIPNLAPPSTGASQLSLF